MLVAMGRYRITLHAEQERDAERLQSMKLNRPIRVPQAKSLKIIQTIHEGIRPLY